MIVDKKVQISKQKKCKDYWQKKEPKRISFKVKYTDNSTAWTGEQELVKTHGQLVNDYVLEKINKGVEKDTESVLSKITSSTSSDISIKTKKSRQRQWKRKRSWPQQRQRQKRQQNQA